MLFSFIRHAIIIAPCCLCPVYYDCLLFSVKCCMWHIVGLDRMDGANEDRVKL